MRPALQIAPLLALPAATGELRIEAAGEGFRFVDKLITEWHSGTNRFAQAGKIFLAACRADELIAIGGLNHDPYADLAEMIRVTRACGRVSALEPEWDTFVIAGDDLATARTVARWHATNCCVQPDIGRRLVQLLLDAGCHDLQLDVEVLVVRDLKTADFIFRIHDELQSAINEGAVAQEAGEVWWEALGELDAKGQFFSSGNVVICAGTVY